MGSRSAGFGVADELLAGVLVQYVVLQATVVLTPPAGVCVPVGLHCETEEDRQDLWICVLRGVRVIS